eukprot:TRINITY_DN920_c0_g1_i1.p1 TRINITY_DN920_c0_g1~~TRINITY_DN920_c0_g1_i1.p1  ORF type:complete len:996 (-),score=324.67 TRINITY_DN920_c0_g1_i1:291-3152(-)
MYGHPESRAFYQDNRVRMGTVPPSMIVRTARHFEIEPDLGWIAQMIAESPLPPGWNKIINDKENVIQYSFKDGPLLPKHPGYPFFMEAVLFNRNINNVAGIDESMLILSFRGPLGEDCRVNPFVKDLPEDLTLASLRFEGIGSGRSSFRSSRSSLDSNRGKKKILDPHSVTVMPLKSKDNDNDNNDNDNDNDDSGTTNDQKDVNDDSKEQISDTIPAPEKLQCIIRKHDNDPDDDDDFSPRTGIGSVVSWQRAEGDTPGIIPINRILTLDDGSPVPVEPPTILPPKMELPKIPGSNGSNIMDSQTLDLTSRNENASNGHDDDDKNKIVIKTPLRDGSSSFDMDTSAAVGSPFNQSTGVSELHSVGSNSCTISDGESVFVSNPFALNIPTSQQPDKLSVKVNSIPKKKTKRMNGYEPDILESNSPLFADSSFLDNDHNNHQQKNDNGNGRMTKSRSKRKRKHLETDAFDSMVKTLESHFSNPYSSPPKNKTNPNNQQTNNEKHITVPTKHNKSISSMISDDDFELPHSASGVLNNLIDPNTTLLNKNNKKNHKYNNKSPPRSRSTRRSRNNSYASNASSHRSNNSNGQNLNNTENDDHQNLSINASGLRNKSNKSVMIAAKNVIGSTNLMDNVDFGREEGTTESQTYLTPYNTNTNTELNSSSSHALQTGSVMMSPMKSSFKLRGGAKKNLGNNPVRRKARSKVMEALREAEQKKREKQKNGGRTINDSELLTIVGAPRVLNRPHSPFSNVPRFPSTFEEELTNEIINNNNNSNNNNIAENNTTNTNNSTNNGNKMNPSLNLHISAGNTFQLDLINTNTTTNTNANNSSKFLEGSRGKRPNTILGQTAAKVLSDSRSIASLPSLTLTTRSSVSRASVKSRLSINKPQLGLSSSLATLPSSKSNTIKNVEFRQASPVKLRQNACSMKVMADPFGKRHNSSPTKNKTVANYRFIKK